MRLSLARPTLAAALLGLVACYVALAPVSASAAPKTLNGFVGVHTTSSAAGSFISQDLVVYTAGDSNPANDKILTAERSGMRVQRLDAHGNPELAWGGDAIASNAPGDTGTGFEVCDVAVSGAEGCKLGVEGTAAGVFSAPTGIAVNQSTGHVYVLDRDNQRVQEFTIDGGFVRTWGWGVATGAATFEICTSSCLTGLAGSGDGQIGSTGSGSIDADLVGIAVDPVNGDVFVADPGATANRRVQQFTADGTFVAKFGASGSGLGEFGSSQPTRVAVDSNHIVYVSDSNDSNRIQRYDSVAGTFLAPIACCSPAAGAPLVAGETFGLEIKPDLDGAGPDEEHLLVARNTSSSAVVQELDIPTPAIDPVTTVVDDHVWSIESSVNLPLMLGLGYSPSDGRILIGTLIYSQPDDIFNGCEQPPGPVVSATCSGSIVLDESGAIAVAVDALSGVTSSSAVVDGSVDPAGGVAKYVAQVSVDGVNWMDASKTRYLSGSGPTAVAATVTGLNPNTLYRVRLRVSKQVGMATIAIVHSSEQVLLTDAAAPEVQTLGSAHRTGTSVQLRGRVDPNGSPTDYRFEYGPAGGSFDHRVPVADASAGSGSSPQIVTQEVDGLTPSRAYQYRIVGSSFAGTAIGEPVRFDTRAPAGPLPGLGDRAFELVSPAYKAGGQGVGEWYVGIKSHGFVGAGSYDGQRFLVQGQLGTVLTDEGKYQYANDWALAERTPAGWSSEAAMNRRAFGRQNNRMINTQAATSDLSLTVWGSNGGRLRLFEEMEDWSDSESAYVRDWDGNWETIGPTDPAQGNANGVGGFVVAEGGSAVVATVSGFRGIAGPGDATLEALPGVNNVFVDDLSDGLSNTFPGEGVRTVANACTAGTTIPRRQASGKLSEQPCPPPPPGRDASLVDRRGAAAGRLLELAAVRAVSSDGSRVFFMAPDPTDPTAGDSPCSGIDLATACPSQLYVRQRNADGSFTTRWISRSEVAGQDASLLAPVTFEGASRDGSRVFFRTAAPLTADDPNGGAPVPGGKTSGDASPQSTDLFMYELPSGPGSDPADGELTRISAGPAGDADANVLNREDSGPTASGAARFIADDGARVYFVAAAPITGLPVSSGGGITLPDGNRSTADASNLYLYDANRPAAERWRFIARLPRTSPAGACATTGYAAAAPLASEGLSALRVNPLANCVRGNSDGSFVTFWTDGRLTADDPDAASGDVYAYDVDSDELIRVSAPQDGVGGTYPCAPPSNAIACYGDSGIGEGSPPLPLGVATDPDLAGDRIAFFNSRSRLVVEDTDDAYDVYQWRNGELSLISTGASDGDGAFYQGNDRSGRSVFLSTLDRLTWQDSDAVMDIYVARVGGGIPQPAPTPECGVLADGCQGSGPGQSPVDIDSGAAGDGNAAPGVRARIALGAIGSRALRRAARTGMLTVPVRTNAPGRITGSLRARLRAGKPVHTISRGAVRAGRAGRVTLRLRLSKAARDQLALGRRLSARVRVSMPEAPERTATVRLERGKRS